jgi:peptidoglycan/LPS O-acetylase OafA/YrhL
LDGLRGVAALAVVVHHVAQRLIMFETGWLHAVMDVCALGFLGVDVFFALSGFLITRILLAQRGSQRYFRNFYARRLLRVAPPYLLIVVIVALTVPGSGGYLLLSLVYLANFCFVLGVPHSYPVLWSLSVEEQFYLLWPALVGAVAPLGLGVVSFAVCLLSPLARVLATFKHTENYAYLSWYHFDGLTWGALLAVLLTAGRWHRGAPACRAVTVMGALLTLAATFLYVTARKDLAIALFYSAAPMLTVALIGYALERPAWLAPLRSGTLRFFGNISYWLYLIHFLFLNEADAFLRAKHPELLARGGWPPLLVMLTAVLVPSIVSGIAVRHFIELPMLRLKGRFADMRSSGGALASGAQRGGGR